METFLLVVLGIVVGGFLLFMLIGKLVAGNSRVDPGFNQRYAYGKYVAISENTITNLTPICVSKDTPYVEYSTSAMAELRNLAMKIHRETAFSSPQVYQMALSRGYAMREQMLDIMGDSHGRSALLSACDDLLPGYPIGSRDATYKDTLVVYRLLVEGFHKHGTIDNAEYNARIKDIKKLSKG